MQPDAPLQAGVTLAIPKATLSANSASTFRPYDPSRVIGDANPALNALPAPQADGGCGGLGQILLLVIIIAVTVYSAGALAAAGTFGSSAAATAASASGIAVSTGASTLGATFAAGGAVLGGGAGVGAAIAAGAVGSALGSVAGQTFGIATGMQGEFDWRSVGLAALSGGVSGGLAGLGGFAPLGDSASFGNLVTRAAVGSALTQGIAVATGLQRSFSWTSVAASAIGSGVGYGANEALGLTSNGNPTNAFSGSDRIGRAALSSVAASTATALAHGGRVSITQIGVNAFGQTIGSSLAEQARMGGTQEERLGSNLEANFRETLYSLSAGNSNSLGFDPSRAGEGIALSRGLRDEFDQRVQDGILALNAQGMTDADRLSTALGLAYGEGSLTPTGGNTARNSTNQPITLRSNGGRADSFFQALAELADAGLVGNPSAQYRDDSNFLNRTSNQKEIDRIRNRFGENARNAPEVGKAFDASGRIVDDFSANNVERFKSYERVLNTMNSGGVMEVDSRYNIVSLGRSRLSPDRFASEFSARYQASFDEGYKTAVELHRQGLLKVNGQVDVNVSLGQFADKFARDDVRYYVNQERMTDLQNGVVSINRRLYGDDMFNVFRVPDTKLDFGPDKRLILDGTIGTKGNYTPQINDFRLGFPNTQVIVVRPYTLGGPEILGRTNRR